MSNPYTSLGLVVSQLVKSVPDAELSSIAHNAEHAIEDISEMLYHTARTSVECEELPDGAYRRLCESIMVTMEVSAAMRDIINADEYVKAGHGNPYRDGDE